MAIRLTWYRLDAEVLARRSEMPELLKRATGVFELDSDWMMLSALVTGTPTSDLFMAGELEMPDGYAGLSTGAVKKLLTMLESVPARTLERRASRLNDEPLLRECGYDADQAFELFVAAAEFLAQTVVQGAALVVGGLPTEASIEVRPHFHPGDVVNPTASIGGVVRA